MLRAAIAVVSIIFVAGALVTTMHDPASMPMLVVALMIAGACLFERRYHTRNRDLQGSRFLATEERFVDPESGRIMVLWVDSTTGERRYVDEAAPPAPIA